jgi:thioredoxin-like negative regulator of GroEL
LTELEQLAEQKDKLIILEVDAEKFSELAQNPPFNVRTVPTLFLFHDGKIIKSERGNLSTQQLKEFVNI